MSSDAMGNPVRVREPLQGESRSAFDTAGHLIQHIDAEGHTTTFSYDVAGRLTRRISADGKTVRYGYDDAGNPIAVEDGSFPIRYTYDTAGRLTRIEYPRIQKSLGYSYDNEGRLSEFIDWQGRRLRYAFDQFERLGSETLPDGGAFQLTYDNRDRPVGIRYPNKTKKSIAYDAMGRVDSISIVNPAGEPVAGWDYKYDAAGRLTAESGPAGTFEYTYSPGGNRLSFSDGERSIQYRYNAAGQLVAAGDESFAYDGRGNLVERRGTEGVTRYGFDTDNRLIRVTLPNGQTVKYGYGPTGERIWREDGAGRTWLLSDGRNLLAELDEKFVEIRRYWHGPGLDNPLVMWLGGEPLFYLTDKMGSVAAMVTSAGLVEASYLTDAFGVVRDYTAATANPFVFTARELDPVTSLYDYRARVYDPHLERFLSPDPIRRSPLDPEGFSRYAYARNTPTRYTDPTGLDIRIDALKSDPFNKKFQRGPDSDAHWHRRWQRGWELRGPDPNYDRHMPGHTLDEGGWHPPRTTKFIKAARPPRLQVSDRRWMNLANQELRNFGKKNPILARDMPETAKRFALRNLSSKIKEAPAGASPKQVHKYVKMRQRGLLKGPQDYPAHWSEKQIRTAMDQAARTKLKMGPPPPGKKPPWVIRRTETRPNIDLDEFGPRTQYGRETGVGPLEPQATGTGAGHQPAPVAVQNKPPLVWSPTYKGPTGLNRGWDTVNWEKIPKAPYKVPYAPTILTVLVTTEMILKCREEGLSAGQCAKRMLTTAAVTAGMAGGAGLLVAKGVVSAPVVVAVGGVVMTVKGFYDWVRMGYENERAWEAMLRAYQIEKERSRRTSINLVARLDEDIESMHRLIVSTMVKHTLTREGACKALGELVKQASKSHEEAKTEKAAIPLEENSYTPWLRAIDECKPAAEKQVELNGILEQNRFALEELKDHLQEAAVLASKCLNKTDSEIIREKLKKAGKIGEKIVINKNQARKIAGQLKEVLVALRTAKGAYGYALVARDRIIQLASGLPREQALSELISIVDTATRTLTEEGNRLKKKVDLLRNGYPDKVKPEVEKKFKQLKALISEYQDRGRCNSMELRNKFNEPAGKVVEIRLSVENKLKPFIDRHQEIEDCPTESPDGVLKQIIETKVESEVMLEKAKDLSVIAAECESASDKSKATITLRRLRSLVDNFADIKIMDAQDGRFCYAPKPLQLKAGQQSKLFLEYAVNAPPGTNMKIRIEPRIVGWVYLSDGKAHPLKLPPVVEQVRLGKREKQRVLHTTIPLQIPYPSLRAKEKKTNISPHELYLDVFANNKKLYTISINDAFEVRGPGTDFNGTGDLDVCVMEKGEKDAYRGNVRITVAGPGSVSKTFSGPTCRMKFDEKADFEKLRLGTYKVRADVLDDQDDYKGPRSGTTTVTLFRWGPKDRHVKPWFGATIELGRGSKKPGFVNATDPDAKPIKSGPKEWYIHVKVIDNKKKGISRARVYTASGAISADDKGKGIYLLGPIKNIENRSERTIDVTADISFHSPLNSPLTNLQIRTVTLKDKPKVDLTFQFDIVAVPDFVGGSEAGGSGGSGGSSTSSGSGPTPPEPGGRSKDSDKSTGNNKGQGGVSGVGSNTTQTNTGTGSVEIGQPRDRIYCIRKACTMCGEHLMGAFYGKDCNDCIKRDRIRIEKCIEGYKHF